MQVAQGQDVTLTTTYRDAGGVAVDVTDPRVQIFNASGVSVNGPAIPANTGIGSYSYLWDNPAEPAGWYRAVWTGTYLGAPVTPGEEWFEVVPPGLAVTMDDVAYLRMLAGDRIGIGENESDGFFSNHDLQLILNEAGGNAHAAASICWRAKAAHYAELVDVDESGSSRKMSQKFKQAEDMAQKFAIQSETTLEALRSGFRVVGRAMNLGREDDGLSALTPFSGYTDHIRVYPLKRFPAVLG